MRYDGQKVLVVGLGASGQAAVRFFARRGARVEATDSSNPERLGAIIESLRPYLAEIHLGGHPDKVFLEQDLIVPSPGVDWRLPQLRAARHNGVRVAGELDFAADELRGRVIGVTGANGKTTTVSLIGHILREAGLRTVVGGNIGRPLLDMVEESTDDQWSVLELSSFQLEAASAFRCHIAAILNITPDHLDRHGSFEAYVAAKAKILASQTPDDAAVLNRDDAATAALAGDVKGRLVWFQRSRPADRGAWADGGRIWFEGRPVGSTDLPIRGAHNLENALAAAAVAALAGVPDHAIASGLQSFQAVEHRLEKVATIGGVDYYNDSKATNVDATRKAVESFAGGLWLMLGGRDKQGDFASLADLLRGRVRELLLVGEAAPTIRAQLEGVAPLVDCGTIEAALRYAAERAQPGETVLLSPACASFDQFENYARRGREFKRLVAALATEPKED
ncbi:MAG: UDP-N-acetylmuramoyl-L-alanine--D-glutamate ligase [Acidobacteria bacterium]|nr:UDP-N-acetylmuramoyl-L-alanine--D-glutamate ligase [Acidobacteriota bacterium]